MKPKDRKLKFLKDLMDAYGCGVEITRQQIIDVWSKSPDQYTHHLPMETQLRVGRGVYKTPKSLMYHGEVQPDVVVNNKPVKKQRTVKDVIDILSLEKNDDMYYNDSYDDQEDIKDILRLL